MPNIDAAGAMIRVSDADDGDPADTSGTFSIQGITDADNDQLDDDWETVQFGDLTASDGTGDADDDGFSDLQEFWQGSDPHSASSGLAEPEVGGCVAGRGRTPLVPIAALVFGLMTAVLRRREIPLHL